MQQLIAALPRYDHFSENWHFKQTNWLPFYWLGFTQTTYYTYRLSMLSDQQKLWNSFRENIRREIRKAERRYQLRVRTDLGVDAFLQLNAQTFKRQGHNIPYSKNLVARLDDACVERHARRIFVQKMPRGELTQVFICCRTINSAYYLMGGGDPELRTSGATSLCMWEAIEFASSVTKSFDFGDA